MKNKHLTHRQHKLSLHERNLLFRKMGTPEGLPESSSEVAKEALKLPTEERNKLLHILQEAEKTKTSEAKTSSTKPSSQPAKSTSPTESAFETRGSATSDGKVPLIASPEIRVAATVGGSAFALSYLASLSHLSHFGSAAGLGFLGYYLAKKKIIFSEMPKAGPPLATGLGVLAPPAIKSIGSVVASKMGLAAFFANPTALTATAVTISGVGGLALGGWVGKKLGLDGWTKHTASLATMGGLGYAAYSVGGASALSLVTTGLNFIPAGALSVSSLIPAASLGLTAGAGAGALYGMGRMGRWMDGIDKPEGLMKTMWGGAKFLPWTLPKHALNTFVGGPWRWTKREAGREGQGLKRIAAGEGVAGHALWAAPRAVGDVIASPFNGLGGQKWSDLQSKNGLLGKVTKTPLWGAGRVARSPLDAAKWLFTPRSSSK